MAGLEQSPEARIRATHPTELGALDVEVGDIRVIGQTGGSVRILEGDAIGMRSTVAHRISACSSTESAGA